MGRIERATEYYVTVYPESLGGFGLSYVSDNLIEADEAKRLVMYREACEAIVDQIKRHVDDVGSVTVKSETEGVCEFCGRCWTEGPDSPHNGGCCGKDCDMYETVTGEEG